VATVHPAARARIRLEADPRRRIRRTADGPIGRDADDGARPREEAGPMSITSSCFLRRTAPAALGVVVASTLAASAAGGQSGRTLVFTGRSAHDPREYKQIDVRPRGQSIGDRFLVSGSLRAGGRIAGRGHVTCTVIDRRYHGQDCAFVLVLRDGTITAAGGGVNRLLPGQSPSPPHAADEFAVTGGTGAYRGASGTLSLQEDAHGSTTLTVSL
jgi:hypothetical protein